MPPTSADGARRVLQLLPVIAPLIAIWVGCVVWVAPSVRVLGAEPARTDAADVRRLFESGNDKFREALDLAKTDRPVAEAKFREAAGSWREAARLGGIQNVKLQTNIANASLLAGDVPGAILAYRRALAIDPTDTGVLSGLAAARRSAGTEALALGQSPAKKDEGAVGLRGAVMSIGRLVGAALERLSTAFSSRVLIAVAGLCYLGFFAGAALRVLGWFRVPAWAMALLIAGIVAATGPLVVRELRVANRADAVVLVPNVIARNGPADLYEPAFQEPLRAGLEVSIVETRGSWSKIRLRDGREAWVRADTIAQV